MLIIPGGYDLYAEAQLPSTTVRTVNTSDTFPQYVTNLEDVREKKGWCLCRALIDQSAAQGKSSIELNISVATTSDFPGSGDLTLHKQLTGAGAPLYLRFPLNSDVTYVHAELKIVSIGSHTGDFNGICQIWTDIEYVLRDARHQLEDGVMDWATTSWFRDLDGEGTV